MSEDPKSPNPLGKNVTVSMTKYANSLENSADVFSVSKEEFSKLNLEHKGVIFKNKTDEDIAVAELPVKYFNEKKPESVVITDESLKDGSYQASLVKYDEYRMAKNEAVREYNDASYYEREAKKYIMEIADLNHDKKFSAFEMAKLAGAIKQALPNDFQEAVKNDKVFSLEEAVSILANQLQHDSKPLTMHDVESQNVKGVTVKIDVVKR